MIPGKKTWTKTHGTQQGETPAVACQVREEMTRQTSRKRNQIEAKLLPSTENLTALAVCVAGWGLKQSTDAAEIQQQFDVCFETSSIEGWPLLVVEVWDRTQAEGERRFCGCGAITLPTSPGKHVIDCVTWRPVDTWWSSITGETLLRCVQC